RSRREAWREREVYGTPRVRALPRPIEFGGSAGRHDPAGERSSQDRPRTGEAGLTLEECVVHLASGEGVHAFPELSLKQSVVADEPSARAGERVCLPWMSVIA